MLFRSRLAERDVHELIELSTDRRIPIWRSVAEMVLGVVRVHDGNHDSGSDLFSQGIERYLATGGRLGVGRWFPAYLADAFVLSGNPRGGNLALEQAPVADDVMRFQDPELVRLQADLLALNAAPEPVVESAYAQALALSRELGARAVELRASVALARYRIAQGHSDVGELLEPVSATFSDEQSCFDLDQARGLLSSD